ncbi:phage tail domain-containing protein [Bacillus gaemokensis]|uniref:Siphovirus-type tail component RIFT-related domain-containing protein n=1 Tax=Bacillus gaemokensis TaxID=574375 RepID=A0A073K7E0_9BACI|nr:phage tail domain-containing protein [Bacillus gaemokensis]KEK22465.1 hypothetical protein BAGA_18835 [Bacillus gaemokensis]KYG28840.1 phage tail protein [Bacillus gaemokensis]
MKLETVESGVFIDDVKLQDIGVMALLDSDEPLFPDVRENSVVIPGRHGAYNFGSYLQPLEFELKCAFDRQETYTDLAYQIREFKKLFIDGYGRPKRVKLRFESEPDKFYYVEYNGRVPIERIAHFGLFSLPLKAYDPHAYSTSESTDDVLWGSDVVTFMSDILLGIGDSSYVVTSPQTISIDNVGSLIVRPIVEISGSAENLALTLNGERFLIGSFTNSSFVIDAERYSVMKDGKNYLFQMQGNLEKLELVPGANAVSIGGSNLNVNIALKFRAKYI